jgi:hypothetical protein
MPRALAERGLDPPTEPQRADRATPAAWPSAGPAATARADGPTASGAATARSPGPPPGDRPRGFWGSLFKKRK